MEINFLVISEYCLPYCPRISHYVDEFLYSLHELDVYHIVNFNLSIIKYHYQEVEYNIVQLKL